MLEWQVHFEFAHALSTDRIDDLFGPLGPYHVSLSGGNGFETSGITMTVVAPTATGALDAAWQAVTAAEPFTRGEVRAIEVRPMPYPD